MPPIIDEGIVRDGCDAAMLSTRESEGSPMAGGKQSRRRYVSAIVVLLVALTGCDGFFVPEPNGNNGGTGGRVYVTNSTTKTLAGFTIGTGTLTAVPNSPLSLGYTAVDAVATPDNAFVYVAGPGAIYVYKINSDGSVTAPSGGAGAQIVNVVSLAISPDGNWLFGLDNLTTVL